MRGRKYAEFAEQIKVGNRVYEIPMWVIGTEPGWVYVVAAVTVGRYESIIAKACDKAKELPERIEEVKKKVEKEIEELSKE